VSIPAEKHQVARERRVWQAAAVASAVQNIAAAKASAELTLTIRSELM
jgi:hypothetical protein